MRDLSELGAKTILREAWRVAGGQATFARAPR